LSPDLLVLLNGLDMLVAFERVDLVLGELHTTVGRGIRLFYLGGAGEMGNGVVVNIREALDERVFVRDLAALVFGMLLGSGPRAIR